MTAGTGWTGCDVHTCAGEGWQSFTLLDDFDITRWPVEGPKLYRQNFVAGDVLHLCGMHSQELRRAVDLHALHVEVNPHAEAPRRGPGRPRVPGTVVELKLLDVELAEVQALVGELGPDRSTVLAVLVRRGLRLRNLVATIEQQLADQPVEASTAVTAVRVCECGHPYSSHSARRPHPCTMRACICDHYLATEQSS